MSPSTDRLEQQEFATELKFLVDPARAAEIRHWIGHRLDLDPHAGPDGTYLVTSLYFDTPDHDVYFRNGSYGRSKYRVRRYGDSSEVFLERKMKRKDRVRKRRTPVPLSELACVDGPSAPMDWEGYWFRRRLAARRLESVCQITYQRAAFARVTSQGVIRLTIDSHLAAAPVDAPAFQRGSGNPLFAHSIVEVKFRRHLPPVFQDLTRRFLLTPQPVSKYRRAAEELGLVRETCLTY